MATKKYNPYDDVKAIVDLKAQYNEAKAKGKDYQQYQQQAVPYYQNIIANERGSVADKLAEMDYTEASKYLAETYQPTQPYQELYDTLSGIGTGEVKTSDDSYTKWRDDLMGIGTGQVSPKASEEVSGMVDDYRSLINRLQGLGEEQLDYLNNFDYTKQSYFDPIMQTYQLYGSNAANGQLASGAAANAGNIDSYAAANAARQQLAFTNAGHQAALAAAQQNQGNWQTLYNQMSGNVSDFGTNTKSMYDTDSEERKAAVDAVESMYGKDSEERKSALTEAAGIINQQAISDAQKYVADKNYDSTVYQWDIEKYLGELGYDTDTARIAADQAIAESDNAAAMERLLKEYELQNAAAVNTAKNITNGSPLVDETAAYKAMYSGTDSGSRNEMTSYLQNAISQMKTGKYSDLKTFDDVKSAVLEVFPQFENEIDDYIKEYTKQSLTNTRGLRTLG